MHIIRSDDNYLSFDIERGLKYNKDWNFKTN